MAQRPRLLLIATDQGRNAATMRDHVAALQRFSRFDVHVVNNYYPRIRGVYARATSLPPRVDLDAFDAVVVHYTCEFSSPTSFDPGSWDRLKRYRGLKGLFLQDEYQNVDRTVGRIREAGIDVFFTCVPESEWEKVYPSAKLPGLRRVQTLTGFVPEYLLGRPAMPIRARPIDVGYRARVVPYWLGELGAEKWQIATRFAEATRGTGLALDVSVDEASRLYGRDWTRFLASCKAILGVESGASVFDFTGELRAMVDRYRAEHPEATFEQVQRQFLLDHEHKVRLNQISPRCFEAAAMRTAMVLYEGEYSGILKAGRHFIALRKDFGNIAEVVERLKDHAYLQSLADCTYEEVALNPAHSFRAFVAHFDRVLEEEMTRRQTRTARAGRVAVFATLSPTQALVSTALSYWLGLPQGLRRAVKQLGFLRA